MFGFFQIPKTQVLPMASVVVEDKQGKKKPICTDKSTDMKQHLLSHTGRKPVVCPHCGMQFQRSDVLKSHLYREHGIGEKKLGQHICEVCGIRMLKPSELKRHIMKHTGEKPFKCEYCEMAYRRNDELRNHIQKKHGEQIAVLGTQSS